MNKRAFLKTLGVAAAALAVQPSGVVSAFAPQSRRTKNFLWLRPDIKKTADDWKREFARMRESGIDGINPEIYNGSSALYTSKRFPVRAPWLDTALPLARAAGLEVNAWMWTMPCLLPEILKGHPDWYNVNAKGENAATKPAYVDYYKFMDPARPEVREFIRDTVRELAAIPGLSGIHLDYVRHPDAVLPSGLWSKYGIVQDRVYPPYDYGYTEYSRAKFKAAHGVDPITLPDPETNAAWLQYRLDTVVDLVNDYLVPAAHAGGKTITAAVFPGPGRAKTMVRQDWGRFRLDGYFPMLYHAFYDAGPEFVKTYTQEAVRTVTAPVYSGLYIAPLKDDEFERTIQMALEGGAAGVSIFDHGAMTPARWALVKRVLA